MSRALNLLFCDRLLRDLLRDLSLSDRLRRRSSGAQDRRYAADLDAARSEDRSSTSRLIVLFGLQHSVMARPAFKARWTRVVPPAAERSVYVLARKHRADCPVPRSGSPSTHRLAGRADMAWLSDILWALFWAGFGIVLISTFLINHFELFGLQQAWFNLRGTRAAEPGTPAAAILPLGRATRSMPASSSASGRRRT